MHQYTRFSKEFSTMEKLQPKEKYIIQMGLMAFTLENTLNLISKGMDTFLALMLSSLLLNQQALTNITLNTKGYSLKIKSMALVCNWILILAITTMECGRTVRNRALADSSLRRRTQYMRVSGKKV